VKIAERSPNIHHLSGECEFASLVASGLGLLLDIENCHRNRVIVRAVFVVFGIVSAYEAVPAVPGFIRIAAAGAQYMK